MSEISFTIPMEEQALLKTAKYLQDLAGATEVDAVKAFAEDTPVDMEERIDEAVAGAGAGAGIGLPGATLDSEGFPWDPRIHASSKALVADGTWRVKRSVAVGLIEQVKAELKALTASAVAPGSSETTPPSTVVYDPNVVAAPVTEAPTTPPAPPVEEVVETVAPINTYPELVQLITARAAAGGLMAPDVSTACTNAGAAAAGFVDLPGLAGAPVFIPLVAEELRKLWATRG